MLLSCLLLLICLKCGLIPSASKFVIQNIDHRKIVCVFHCYFLFPTTMLALNFLSCLCIGIAVVDRISMILTEKLFTLVSL